MIQWFRGRALIMLLRSFTSLFLYQSRHCSNLGKISALKNVYDFYYSWALCVFHQGAFYLVLFPFVTLK